MRAFIVLHAQGLQLALSFLTTLPIPRIRNFEADVQAASLLWYPFVGLILGLLLCLVAPLLPGPWYLQAGLLALLWIGLTGGLHLDGLADCADAWLGGLGDQQRTLDLLKDPLCGAMGVIALVFAVLLKVLALAALLQAGSLQWLWVALVLPRAALLGLFMSTPYVRAGGLGEVLARQFSRPAATRVLGIYAFILLLLLPFQLWAWSLLVVLLSLALVRHLACRRLGGFTGDVAGALVEIQECILLIVLAAQA